MRPFAARYEGLTLAGALPAFAEAAHDEPADAVAVDLQQWRMLKSEYSDLQRVRSVCEEFAARVVEDQGEKQRAES